MLVKSIQTVLVPGSRPWLFYGLFGIAFIPAALMVTTAFGIAENPSWMTIFPTVLWLLFCAEMHSRLEDERERMYFELLHLADPQLLYHADQLVNLDDRSKALIKDYLSRDFSHKPSFN